MDWCSGSRNAWHLFQFVTLSGTKRFIYIFKRVHNHMPVKRFLTHGFVVTFSLHRDKSSSLVIRSMLNGTEVFPGSYLQSFKNKGMSLDCYYNILAVVVHLSWGNTGNGMKLFHQTPLALHLWLCNPFPYFEASKYNIGNLWGINSLALTWGFSSERFEILQWYLYILSYVNVMLYNRQISW